MMKLLLIPVLLLMAMLSHSQYIHKIKADSVLITNDSCNAELNLENSTKHIPGFLYNKGNGRTEFRKGLVKINDSLYIIGGDTLNIRSGLSSGDFIRNQNSSAQSANGWINGGFAIGTSSFNGSYKLDVKDGGVRFTNGAITIDNSSTSENSVLNTATATSLQIAAQTRSTTTTGLRLAHTNASPTSGNFSGINLSNSSTYSFDPASGSASYKMLDITHNINQTGTANGTIYGIYYNPSLTSLLGTHYSMYLNSGMVYSSGNVGIGTLPTSSYSLNLLSSTNASAQMQFTNGGLNVRKSNSQVVSTYQSWARTSPTSTFYLQYQNANTQYSTVPEIGTLNGHNIGASFFVTSGTHSSGNGLATLVFDDQTSATNPNSLIMMLDNGKRPMSWRKDGSTTISSDGLMAHYVAGTDVAGKRLKLSGGRSTGTGAGGNIEFYTTAAGGSSGSTLNAETLRMTLSSSGNLGIGTSLPTARLHVIAGTSSTNTAPIKLTAGTNLTTPENGAVEYDGTNYYATSNSVRYTIARTLTTISVLNFASTAAGASTDLTITLTGAANGDVVSLGVPNESTSANGLFTAWVSADNTVTVRFSNNDLTNAIDPASGTFRVSILKY